MKWSNEEYWASTLTEFMSAHDFWCEVNGVKTKSDAPSRARLEELKRRYG